jgi:hypothetical protein
MVQILSTQDHFLRLKFFSGTYSGTRSRIIEESGLES